MIWNRKARGLADDPVHNPGDLGDPVDVEALDPVLKQALGEFKSSVRAWSDAAYSRPRVTREFVVRKRKVAVGWSFAAVLLAGALSGGLYQLHRQDEMAARIAAQRRAEEQKQADARQRALNAQKDAQKDEEMLASVDNDLSREAPAAMEPLVQLADEGESR
jgi:hypothetical protein